MEKEGSVNSSDKETHCPEVPLLQRETLIVKWQLIIS